MPFRRSIRTILSLINPAAKGLLGDRLAVGTSLFQAMDRDSLMSQPPTFSMRIEKAAIGVLASRPSPEVQRDIDFAKKALSRS